MFGKGKIDKKAKGVIDAAKKAASSDAARKAVSQARKAADPKKAQAAVRQARKAAESAVAKSREAANPPPSSSNRKGAPQIEGYDGVYAIMFQRLRGWLARSALRWSMMLNLLLGATSIILGISLATVANQPPPQPVYFATNPDGTVTKLVPLSRPNRTKSAVLNWAGQVVTECLTFNFVNMERKVAECENGYFTNKGAGSYRKALIAARLFEDVKQGELFHVTSLRGPAVIAKTGKVGKNKRLAYIIKVPVHIRVTGPRIKESVVESTVTIMAVRVAVVDKPAGIAVHQFMIE